MLFKEINDIEKDYPDKVSFMQAIVLNNIGRMNYFN